MNGTIDATSAAMARQVEDGQRRAEALHDAAGDDQLDIGRQRGNQAAQRGGQERQQDGATIINVGSIAGETGHGSSIPYAVSKAAMHGLTKSLARALAPEIRVNGIMPGAVATRWWAGHKDKMHQLAGDLPLARISTPDDIAETVMLLIRSRSMTGQNIKAENGQTL